jgi:hypothetical protein
MNPLVFYRPSIWKCLDCGYEGAFIIEDGELVENLQTRCRVIDWLNETFHIDDWDGSTDNCRKL